MFRVKRGKNVIYYAKTKIECENYMLKEYEKTLCLLV